MRQNRKNWTHQQDETIVHLVKKFGTKRWTLISEKMKERFPQDGRSGKQCRQRWHNHLSPIINKDPWSDEQIKLVFDSHRKFGNKWTQIAQLLEGRTDNAVKNQFYSTLRKGLRRICKILGTRNSTTRIKKIKPSALSSLISNFTQIPVQQGENQQELYDMLFQFSSGDKYQELKQKQVNEKSKQKMQRLLEKIIDNRQSGKRKRSKSSIKQHNNKQNQIKSESQRQKIQNQSENKQIQQGLNKFDFNIDLQDDQNNQPRNIQGQFNINQQNNPSIVFPFHYDQFDSRLQKPIFLKKQNSVAQSVKQQQFSLNLKKKNSEHQKLYKKSHDFQIHCSQNYLKGFLSKSPNFSSKIKMPTPRLNENPHYLMFNPIGQDLRQDGIQKNLNIYVQQLKNKIDLKKQKQRIR